MGERDRERGREEDREREGESMRERERCEREVCGEGKKLKSNFDHMKCRMHHGVRQIAHKNGID